MEDAKVNGDQTVINNESKSQHYGISQEISAVGLQKQEYRLTEENKLEEEKILEEANFYSNQQIYNQPYINQNQQQQQLQVIQETKIPTGCYYKFIQQLKVKSDDIKTNYWKDPISQYNYTIEQYNQICEDYGQQKLKTIYNPLINSIWWNLMVFVKQGCFCYTPNNLTNRIFFIIIFIIAWIVPYLIIGINYIILILHLLSFFYILFAIFISYQNQQKVNQCQILKNLTYKYQIFYEGKYYISFLIQQNNQHSMDQYEERWDFELQQESNSVRAQRKELLYTNDFVEMYRFLFGFKCYIVYSLHIINAIIWTAIAQNAIY